MSVFDEILSENPSPNPIASTAKASSTSLDPRSDIAKDHHLWQRVLKNAQAMYDTHKTINGNQTSLYKILHGLRCGGARLEETKQAFKLHPGDEDWSAPEVWEQIKRQWLDPVKDDLIALFHLSKLGEVVDEELPPGVFAESTSTTQTAQAKQVSLFG